MDEFLAEVRSETVSVNEDEIEGVERARPPAATPSLRTAPNRKVFVEKSTRFVQIDVNKLRYLLDEKRRVDDEDDAGRGVNPLLDWAVEFQKAWGTLTLFLAGLLAGFGTFQLVLLGVLRHHGRDSLSLVSYAVNPSTTAFNFLYVWALLGSLERCDLGGLDLFSFRQRHRIGPFLCSLLYLVGFACSLVLVHLDDLAQFGSAWFGLNAARASLPILCWLVLARIPSADALAARLSSLGFGADGLELIAPKPVS